MGLIPARAGRTVRLAPLARSHWAHPRAGGADCVSLSTPPHSEGSSPRGRGGLRRPGQRHAAPGLIPARAGRTRPTRSGRRGFGAHPRAGGADTDVHPSRSRGSGLIPARAGRTRSSCRRSPRPWAHPRAGGADMEGFPEGFREGGSSPRGRGGLLIRAARLGVDGLIPARAGRTPDGSAACAERGAHPRAGGADGPTYEGQQITPGSSPRGRGGPSGGRSSPMPVGLIPARAGRTVPCCLGTAVTGAHPRAGGADGAKRAHTPESGGSSPRGRGGQRDHAGRAVRRGLIPARAGRTPAHATRSI